MRNLYGEFEKEGRNAYRLATPGVRNHVIRRPSASYFKLRLNKLPKVIERALAAVSPQGATGYLLCALELRAGQGDRPAVLRSTPEHA
jgi:hypothetical protein